MPHLFVDISSHGFGHLAQTGPVLDALAVRVPGLRLTIRSGLPAAKLRSRIAAAFTHLAAASDTAFLMHDALRIDRAATAAAYLEAHADWPGRVAAEADFLTVLAPDLVLSNISALPLAGARRAGIPALALCSLNWADQFHHLYAADAWAAPIHRQLHEAYAGADLFLRCTPAMPMPTLANCRAIPPIARCGKRQRALLAQGAGAAGRRIVLVAMGGIGFALPVAQWPQTSDILWLVPEVSGVLRDDVRPYPELGFHFADLLASVDAVLTKPGYGMFVEAAAAGTPLLYLRREAWPEQEALIAWLEREAVSAELALSGFVSGECGEALASLWSRPRRAVAADGAGVAADLLAAMLTPGSRNA